MRITCPFCGERPHSEFHHFGDASRVRPADGDAPEVWIRYVYERENTPSVHSEYWYHALGCRSFLTVRRDTSTHTILDVRATDAARALSAGAAS